MVQDVMMVILLVLSIAGYTLFIHKQWCLSMSLCPLVTIASISVAVFIAGILNVLVYTVYLIFGIGLLLFAYCLYCSLHMQHKSLKYTLGFTALALAITFYFYILFHNAILVHYDNFTHWALVVQSIYDNDYFPRFTEENRIIFQSYSLGTASFAYFVCKLIGYSEGNMMLAQMLMMLACCCPVIKIKKNVFSVISAGVCMVILLTYTFTNANTIYDLLVDRVLALAAGAAVIMLLYEPAKDHPERTILLSTPVLCLLVTIKSSGLLFFLVLCVVLLVTYGKRIKERKLLSSFSIAFLSPLLVTLLWRQHVNYVFTNGHASRHSVSLGYFQSIIAQKSPDAITTVIKSMLQAVFSFSNASTVMLMLIIIASLLLYRIMRDKKVLVKYLLLSVLTFISYNIGLLGMYLFSMPSNAILLSGFTRYNSTLAIFLFYIFCSCIYSLFASAPQAKHPLITKAGYMAILASTLLIFPVQPELLINENALLATPRGAFRVDMGNLFQNITMTSDDKVLIYMSDWNSSDKNYAKLVVKYMNYHVTFVNSESLNNCTLSDYQYAAAMIEDDTVRQFWRENFHTDDLTTVIDIKQYGF